MNKHYAAIIIGGGPAGAECGLWLKMLGHQPLIIESAATLGGLQALSPYENHWIVGMRHASGKTLAAQMEAHLKEMEVPFLLNTKPEHIQLKSDGIEVQAGKHVFTSDYLVIATGVLPRRDVFREADHVLIGPGDSTYHQDVKNKRVAILGGGDNAYENQAFMMGKGASLCHIYARTVRARNNLKIQVDASQVFSGAYHVDQDKSQVTHDGITREYDLLVVLYGWEANIPKPLSEMASRLLDDRGFIATNEVCKTPIARVYAIGEVVNRAHPCVVTAMADGVVAAKAIQSLLERDAV